MHTPFLLLPEINKWACTFRASAHLLRNGLAESSDPIGGNYRLTRSDRTMDWDEKEEMAACGGYGIKCDPDMSFGPDSYPPVYQCEQQPLAEPPCDMDLAGFLEMDDKMLSGETINHFLLDCQLVCLVLVD